MDNQGDTLGIWSDHLGNDEVEFSKSAAAQLKSHAAWSNKLLNDPQIKEALSILKQDHQRDIATTKRIKGALFEVRFALALLGLDIQYEYCSLVGSSSIDFKIKAIPSIFLELTSLRESEESKLATEFFGNFYTAMSTTNPYNNAPEITDVLKVQAAIYHKVIGKNGKNIKFTVPSLESINLVIVDCRSICLGMADLYDYYNVAYGSKTLINVEQGMHCREIILQNGKKELIMGVFDENHYQANPIRERLHAIGFVNESEYKEEAMIDSLVILRNPNFFKTNKDLIKVLPARFRKCVK